MSSPVASAASVHPPTAMRGVSLGYCPACSAKAPRGGYTLSMRIAHFLTTCADAGTYTNLPDWAKHLIEEANHE